MRHSILIALGILGCAASQSSPSDTQKVDAGLLLDDLPVRSLSACAGFDRAGLAGADVAVVIDTSESTRDPAGSDIDEDGEIGKAILRRTGNIFHIHSSDPGDSFLAAQVSATRSLIHGVTPGDIRFVVVAFSGSGFDASAPQEAGSDARVESALTDDPVILDEALARVLRAGSSGSTDFAAGMVLALSALTDPRIPNPSSHRIALFMSDSATPVLPGDPAQPRARARGRKATPDPPNPSKSFDPAMKDAAALARRSGTVFHTFGLGGETAHEPGFLPNIAGATGGTFRAVPDPTLLHCELAASLRRAHGS